MPNVSIVHSENISINDVVQVEVSVNDFIDIVNSFESEIVFSGELDYQSKDAYFIFYKGSIVYTLFLKVDTWEEFTSSFDGMQKGAYTSYKEYLDSLDYGIDANEEYQKFVSSDVYHDQIGYYPDSDRTKKKTLYRVYLEYNIRGFEDFSTYKRARYLEISNPVEYQLFISSDWGKLDHYYSRDFTKEDYLEYKDAKEKGFTSKSEYKKAIKLGFTSAEMYGMFIESGYERKEDFDYLINEFPSIVEGEFKAAKQTKIGADEAFEAGHFQESLRKDFLHVEMLLKLAYVIVNKRKVENQISYDDVLKDLKTKYSLEIPSIRKFTKFRKLRNKVVHQDIDISKEDALNAKNCFEEISNILLPFIEDMVEKEFKTK